jgi:thioredoxin-like negative regulator of GroEL
LESETAENYEIKVLPTLIVFNNGEEVERFEGNISFQLCPRRTPKKVQKVIDGLMINKF